MPTGNRSQVSEMLATCLVEVGLAEVELLPIGASWVKPAVWLRAACGA